MAVKCRTKEELAKAINNDAKDIIIVDADLKKHVVRISATGKIAWAVAIGTIAVAVAATVMAPGPGLAVGASFAVASAGSLGVGATSFAVSLAVLAGGVGILNKLRSYTITENNDGSVRLTK